MKCNAYIEKRCKSCVLIELNYEDSIKLKESEFFDLFPKNKIKIIHPTEYCIPQKESRNKAKLAVSKIKNEITFGIYDRNLNFNKLEDCPLHAEGINEILKKLKSLIEKYKLSTYSIPEKKGELKNIIITKSISTSEMMVRFVARSKSEIDQFILLTKELVKLDMNIAVVSLNIQPFHMAILEGDEEIVLTERSYIKHRFERIQLYLGVKSFFQVNSEIAKKLYQFAGDFFNKNKVNGILDLYCGVGAFAFHLAPYTNKIIGIEISEMAIKHANLAIKDNQTTNINFFALNVDDYLKNHAGEFEAIIVNPPRRGLGEANARLLLGYSFEYIFYSSCNVKTLFSDWEILKEKYDIIEAKIFDMFPFSNHFETVLILKRH